MDFSKLKSERISIVYIFNINIPTFSFCFKNSFVIHEGNTKQISTMTVTLYLIKLIDVERILMNIGFYINEYVILYKISS